MSLGILLAIPIVIMVGLLDPLLEELEVEGEVEVVDPEGGRVEVLLLHLYPLPLLLSRGALLPLEGLVITGDRH
jgi:hypothetical protein